MRGVRTRDRRTVRLPQHVQAHVSVLAAAHTSGHAILAPAPRTVIVRPGYAGHVSGP